jgi:hypothetical protein
MSDGVAVVGIEVGAEVNNGLNSILQIVPEVSFSFQP